MNPFSMQIAHALVDCVIKMADNFAILANDTHYNVPSLSLKPLTLTQINEFSKQSDDARARVVQLQEVCKSNRNQGVCYRCYYKPQFC